MLLALRVSFDVSVGQDQDVFDPEVVKRIFVAIAEGVFSVVGMAPPVGMFLLANWKPTGPIELGFIQELFLGLKVVLCVHVRKITA